MRINGNAVRSGMVLDYNNKLWLVVKHELRTPGNLRAFNQVELRDIKSGNKDNVRFSSTEQIERVSLNSRDCNFLFAEGDELTFMDNENYEQFSMHKDMLGDRLPFLQDGMTVTVECHETTPLSVTMPPKATLTIVEADPVVKGQTASSSYKPAVLENGVKVMVPPFIGAGERIVVDINNVEYVERAKD
ncbi:MAG: elongation factor P [Alphaproteobacteria bacterium]